MVAQALKTFSLMDLDTSDIPPIYFTDAQKDQAMNTVAIAIAVFVIFIILYALLQFFKPSVLKNSEAELSQKRLTEIEAAERFVVNFHQLSWKMISPELNRISDSPGKAVSWLFLILWIVGVVVIETGLKTIVPYSPVRNQLQIQVGIIIYFASIIGYFVSRVLSFYREKLQIRKKINAHRKNVLNNGAELYLSPSQLQIGTLEHKKDESNAFDQDFNYRRRIKHITPVLDTINFNLLNIVQILVLFTEFIQLVSFPLRDLFRSNSFIQSLSSDQEKSTRAFINGIRSVFSVFSTGLASTNINYVKFVLCWWLTMIALIIAGTFMILNYLMTVDSVNKYILPSWRKNLFKLLKGPWIITALPLINLFYLMILNAFLEPLGVYRVI